MRLVLQILTSIPVVYTKAAPDAKPAKEAA